jgi:hypothetical protein
VEATAAASAQSMRYAYYHKRKRGCIRVRQGSAFVAAPVARRALPPDTFRPVLSHGESVDCLLHARALYVALHSLHSIWPVPRPTTGTSPLSPPSCPMVSACRRPQYCPPNAVDCTMRQAPFARGMDGGPPRHGLAMMRATPSAIEHLSNFPWRTLLLPHSSNTNDFAAQIYLMSSGESHRLECYHILEGMTVV